MQIRAKMSKTKEELEKEVDHLKKIIASMLYWISGASNAPLNQEEANTLSRMLLNKK